MFSALPPHAHIHTSYTPYHSSPLSSSPLHNSPSPLKERDVNAISPSSPIHYDQDYMMTSPTRTSKSNAIAITPVNKSASLPSPPSSKGGRESVYSKRTTKVNPLIHGRDDGRETRRKLFLKRVREEGEEKRWKGRERSVNGEGEEELEMMRCVWVAEERRRKREAEAVLVFTGEEYELSLDEVMADDVAMEEEAELEALIGQLSQEGVQSGRENEMDLLLFGMDTSNQLAQHQPRPDTPYGSDDEEYDHIFMDVIEEENRMASQQQLSEDQEMMDLS